MKLIESRYSDSGEVLQKTKEDTMKTVIFNNLRLKNTTKTAVCKLNILHKGR